MGILDMRLIGGGRPGRRGGRTFARFFRHSVQALGVTTPRPLLRLLSCADGVPEPEAGFVAAEAPEAEGAEPVCGVLPALGWLAPEYVWLLLSSSASIGTRSGSGSGSRRGRSRDTWALELVASRVAAQGQNQRRKIVGATFRGRRLVAEAIWSRGSPLGHAASGGGSLRKAEVSAAARRQQSRVARPSKRKSRPDCSRMRMSSANRQERDLSRGWEVGSEWRRNWWSEPLWNQQLDKVAGVVV